MVIYNLYKSKEQQIRATIDKEDLEINQNPKSGITKQTYSGLCVTSGHVRGRSGGDMVLKWPPVDGGEPEKRRRDKVITGLAVTN